MPIAHSRFAEAGTITVNTETCNHCGLCVRTCPGDVLRLDGERVVQQPGDFGCIACGHCMMVCPTASITVTGRGASPADLRELPPRSERATADALAALLRARRSVRRFGPGEVERSVLEQIVELAATAPIGIPPWDVGCVVVQGRPAVQRLAARVVEGYASFQRIFRPWVLTLMRPFVKRGMYEQFRTFVLPLAEKLVAHRAAGKDVLFWDAPALLIFHHSPYAQAEDAAIACTYAMLAAESHGLGSTMIGSAGPILQRDAALSREYGIPAGHKAALVLILGHPAVTFQRTVQRQFVDVHWA
ncbi:MAG: nitroreductase family protein [Phycisphaerae bacterium]|jgi:ferredoxin